MANNKSMYRYKGKGPGGDAVYGLGFVGALVYYWQQANTFWMVILGFLKALVWPAFLVHALLRLLHL